MAEAPNVASPYNNEDHKFAPWHDAIFLRLARVAAIHLETKRVEQQKLVQRPVTHFSLLTVISVSK